MHDGSSKQVQNIIKGDKIMCYDGKPGIIKSIKSDTKEMYNIVPIRGNLIQ